MNRLAVFIAVFLINSAPANCSVLCSYSDTEQSIANCANKQLLKVPQSLNSQISRLDLPHNNIQVLDDDSFSRYPNLRHIQLQSNHIYSINPITFLSTKFLNSLYLDHNRLSTLSFFLPTSMERFNARSCALSSIDSTFFDGMKFLESVDLSDNQLREIPNELFKRVTVQSIELSLDFSSNYLTRVTADSMKPLINESSSYSQLKVNLINNPIHCNCLFRWVADFKSNPSKGPTILDVQGTCASPVQVQGLAIKSLRSHEMVCVAPKIENDGAVFEMKEHDDLQQIKCIAKGDPTPTVFYQIRTMNDIVIFPGQQMGRYSVDSHGTLLIKDVKMSDDGVIVCIAGNVVQNTTGVISLVVTGALSQSETATIAVVSVVGFIIILAVAIVIVCLCCFPCCQHRLCSKKRAYSSSSIANASRHHQEGSKLTFSELSRAELSFVNSREMLPDASDNFRNTSIVELANQGYRRSASQRSLLNHSLNERNMRSRQQQIRASEPQKPLIKKRNSSETSEHFPSNLMNSVNSSQTHYQNIPFGNPPPQEEEDESVFSPGPEYGGPSQRELDFEDDLPSSEQLFCEAKLPGAALEMFEEPENFVFSAYPLTSTTRKKKNKSQTQA